MTVERALRALAGFLIMLTVILSALYSHYWLFFTGFIGLNLFQSAFTDWCPAMVFFRKLGFK